MATQSVGVEVQRPPISRRCSSFGSPNRIPRATESLSSSSKRNQSRYSFSEAKRPRPPITSFYESRCIPINSLSARSRRTTINYTSEAARPNLDSLITSCSAQSSISRQQDLNRVWVFPSSSTSGVSSNASPVSMSPVALSPMTLSPTTVPFSALGARPLAGRATAEQSSEESDQDVPNIDCFDLEEPAGPTGMRELMLSPGRVMDAHLYQVLNSSWSEEELALTLALAVSRWEAFVPAAPNGTGYSCPVWPIDALVPRHYARKANIWDEFSPYEPASFRIPARDTQSLLREVLRRASTQDPANAVGAPRRTTSSAATRPRHQQRSSVRSYRSSMTFASRSPSPNRVPHNPAKFLTEHLKLFPDLHEAATDSSNSQNERYREHLMKGQKNHLRSASSKRKEEYLAMLERTRAQRSAQIKRRSMFSPPPVTEVDERGLRRLSLMSSQMSERRQSIRSSERMSFGSMGARPTSVISTHTSYSLNGGQTTPETSFSTPSSPDKQHENPMSPLSAEEYHKATMGRLEGRGSTSMTPEEDVDLVLRLAEMGRKGMAGSLPPGVVESARAKRQASLLPSPVVANGSSTPTDGTLPLASGLVAPSTPTSRARRSYRESITSASSKGSRYPRGLHSPLRAPSVSSMPNGNVPNGAAKHVRMDVPDSVLGDMDGESHDPTALHADSPVENEANVVSSAWHEGPLDGIGSFSGIGAAFGADFGIGEASGHRASGAAAARWTAATPSGCSVHGAGQCDRASQAPAAGTAELAQSAFPSRSSSKATSTTGVSSTESPCSRPTAGCGTRSETGCARCPPLSRNWTVDCVTGRLPERLTPGNLGLAEVPEGPLLDVSLDWGSLTPDRAYALNDSPLSSGSLELDSDVEFDPSETLDEFDVFGPKVDLNDDGPLMDVSLDLELDDDEELNDSDPAEQWVHTLRRRRGSDTESEPELATPKGSPPVRPLIIGAGTDIDVKHRNVLSGSEPATFGSVARQLVSVGLRYHAHVCFWLALVTILTPS